MPLNPNIALGVTAPQIQLADPNSGMNALARAMQIRGMQDESQVNALRMQELQRGVDDRNYLRNALSAPDADPYKIMLNRGMLKEANDYQKNQVEADKTKAQTEKDRFDMAHKRVDAWGQAMGFVRQNPTPENAVGAVRHLVTLGVIPQEMAQQALSGVQNDPQSIAQWATQGFQAALQAKDQLPKYDSRNLGGSHEITATDPVNGRVQVVNSVQNTPTPADQIRAVNEPFTVGPNGQPVPNMPAQNFQTAKARAGATQVSVSTEKGYAGHMAEGLAKQDLSALDAARGAQERITNAQRVKQILDTQPTITGSGAETRLAVSKALSTAGLIDGQAVKSTEDLASLLASSTLDAIRTSGLGSGQGFTDKDRQFLERAKSGNIEINAGTLRTLADLNEKAARASIDAGAKVAQRLKGNPSFGSVGQDISFTQPPEYKPRPPSVVKKPAAAASGGVRFLGFE